MAKLKYKRGQERDIVLEKSNYEDSVFRDQYMRSLNLLNSYMADIDDHSLKSIVYCGGRGDGKTSCMMSTLEIIDQMRDETSDAYRFIKGSNSSNIWNKGIDVMEMIDPSFFDDAHNVLEIIIGHLYNAYRTHNDSITNPDLTQKNQLNVSFQEVKRSLLVVNGGRCDSINELKELSVLSASITLHRQMALLIERYLKFIGKDVLIIPIDDMDLNMDHAYRMCEQIRKYLCVPKCVVMISLKVDQLEKVVSYMYRKSINNETYVPDGEIHEMAERYLNKLLPTSSRIYMPNPFDLGDIEIEINDDLGMIIDNDPLKMALSQFIFYRTRYLFYNPLSGSSPIVPNNMRDIFNMVGLLASMKTVVIDDKDNKESLNENKRLFKSYLYTVWIGQFNKALKSKLEKLVNFDFGTSFNREVIKILKGEFETYLGKDFQSSEDDSVEYSDMTDVAKDSKPVNKIIKSIISPENFGYNISTGDVFYIISFLESETLDESQYALVFFLKCLYSIKLYEFYDDITEKIGMIYPSEQADGLTTVDRRFDHVNVLQQLTGGSYFTYSPGELIPPGTSDGYDLRIIGSKALYELIRNIKDRIDSVIKLAGKENKTNAECSEIEEFNMRLNVMEFFILTLTAQVPQKKTASSESGVSQPIEFMDYARKSVNPYRFRKFTNNSGYFLFDILAPFANILNPKFAYTRFPQIDEPLFEKILNYRGSLLCKMITQVSEYKTHIDKGSEAKEIKEWEMFHRLLSDATIRNSEVLMALKNNIAVRRREKHTGPEETMRYFYAEIQKSGMKTLKRSPEGGVYEIMFRFLNPLQEILRKAFAPDNSADLNDELKEVFNSVFDCREPASRRAYDTTRVNDAMRKEDMKYLHKIIGKATRTTSVRKKILAGLGSDNSFLGSFIIPAQRDRNISIDDVYVYLRKFIGNDNIPLKMYFEAFQNINSTERKERKAEELDNTQQTGEFDFTYDTEDGPDDGDELYEDPDE